MRAGPRIVVAADDEGEAVDFAAAMEATGVAAALHFATSEGELELLAPGCDLLIALHPGRELTSEKVAGIWGHRAAAPAVVVYGRVFAEREMLDLMRSGARDCVRAGDPLRLRSSILRETAEQVAHRQPDDDTCEHYRALIEEIPALTYVAWADDHGSRAYVSPQIEAMTGQSAGEWLAAPTTWANRIHPEDRARVLAQFREACRSRGRFASEYRVLHRDGRVLWWRDEGRVLPDEDGQPRLVRGFVLDVTEQRVAEESLHRLRYYDPLTGLPNHVLLLRRLGQALDEGASAGRAVALVIIAIDRFREMTNALGHENGDRIVREIAVRLGDVVGDPDRVARLRTDEFGLLLPGADAALARQVGERVLVALDRPFVVQKLPIEVSASVGIAVAPDHGSEAELLVRHADAAVQAARRLGGGGRVVYSPECEPFDPVRLALLGELRRALEARGQLHLDYQPKVDLKRRSVVGAEALVRWRHPRRGLVSPEEYIALAEQTALLRTLTRFVLGEACTEAARWERAGWSLSVAVNVSARNIHDGRLVGDVREALDATGLAPERLTIEVTESAVMNDPARSAEVLRGLTSHGISVAIDDFGTGYSSLGLLRRLPVSELKIDKSFVIGMSGDGAEDTAIVRSTAELAHSLGLTVVAEGVENDWTLDVLANFGCDQVQGFHVARPMPGSELLDWVAASPWKGTGRG